MTERANYSGEEDDEPDEQWETTEVQFKVSSEAIGKLETRAKGPANAIVKFIPVTVGVILFLGAGLMMLIGSGTAYAGWFIALAVVMVLVAVALTVWGTVRLLSRPSK